MKKPTADLNLSEDMTWSKSDKEKMECELLRTMRSLDSLEEITRREGLLALEDQIDEIPDLPDVMIEKGVRSVVDGDDFEILEKRLRAWQSFLNARAEIIIQGITDMQKGTKPGQLRENMLAKVPKPLWKDVNRVLKNGWHR